MFSSLVDYVVFGVLGLMNALSLAVIIERVIFYARLNLRRFSSAEECSVEMSKNLVILSIIAQNAPYVGLLGTVFGIMNSFVNIDNSKAIITALAMALKATAGGLIVAIVALVLFNIFERINERKLLKYKQMHGLLDEKTSA